MTLEALTPQPACLSPLDQSASATLLEPLAVELNTSAILCSAPDQVADRYVGTLQTPMIGENKADAILEYCSRNNFVPADCIAFGDHESDLPMLEAVGVGFWVRASGEIEQHRPSGRE